MKFLVLMIPLYLLVTGCATIVRGSSDEVLINTDPDEAGNEKGLTTTVNSIS